MSKKGIYFILTINHRPFWFLDIFLMREPLSGDEENKLATNISDLEHRTQVETISNYCPYLKAFLLQFLQV